MPSWPTGRPNSLFPKCHLPAACHSSLPFPPLPWLSSSRTSVQFHLLTPRRKGTRPSSPIMQRGWTGSITIPVLQNHTVYTPKSWKTSPNSTARPSNFSNFSSYLSTHCTWKLRGSFVIQVCEQRDEHLANWEITDVTDTSELNPLFSINILRGTLTHC